MKVSKPKKGYKLIEIGFDKHTEIPEDWKLTKLINSCLYKKGKKPNQIIDKFEEGFIPYLTPEYLRNGEQPKYTQQEKNTILVNDSDLVLLWDGSNAGEFFLGKIGVLSSTMVKIIPQTETIFDRFLFYVLKFNEAFIRNQTQGIGIPHVNRVILDNLIIYLPPMQEQQKISFILSNVDDLIQNTNKIIDQTKLLKQGLMRKLLIKGIGHTKFKKVKLAFGKDEMIPNIWDSKSVSEIANIIMGQSPNGDSYTTNEGTPLLNGPTEFGSEHPIAVQFTTSPTKLCQRNDILLCVRGSTTGRLNLADREYCIGRGLASIRGLKNIIDTRWLYYQYVNFQNDIYNIASGGGSAFPNINQDLLTKMSLPFPELKEQQKIASIISNIDSQIQKQQKHKSNLESLKKGLMQKLLTGKIPVKI